MTTDIWCVCDRCKTASRVETGNEIPRHWQHRFTPQIGWRDLCPGCVRGIAISEPEYVPVVHGTPRPPRPTRAKAAR